MSKKINISISNKIKPNLSELFHKYLSRKSNIFSMSDEDYYYDDMAEYWDKMFPGWDDDNDADVIYPSNVIVVNPKFNRGKRGKHKHSKNKKAKLFDINAKFSGEEDDLNFDDIGLITPDYDSGHKEIWYYPDYHCKEDRLEFNSVKEFNDYCESMGYFVDKKVGEDISWRYESHCCLNPESEKIGLLEIMSEHSYGEMFYEACEEHELAD